MGGDKLGVGVVGPGVGGARPGRAQAGAEEVTWRALT